MTASGVPRNVQRQIYDKRREEKLPQHGFDIAIIPYFKLDSKKNGKLNRNHEADICTIRMMLNKYININDK